MMNLEPAEIERLIVDHPHLEEKAIVDFINSFSVMSDHLGEKRKISNQGRSARFFDMLAGRSAKREELIDRTFESSFVFIKEYVVNNEKRLAKNEIFLHQAMNGISLISAKLEEVAGDTIYLRESLDALSERVAHMEQSLSQRLDFHDLYNSAMAERDLALSVFAMNDSYFSPEQGLWMLLTRLKYGDFGRWILECNANPERQKNLHAVMQALKNDCLRIMSDHTGRSNHELVNRKNLFKSLSADDELLQEALCLVSEHDSNALESVVLAINSGQATPKGVELPFIFSNASIYEEMSQLIQPGDSYVAIK
jgi:predicted nucleic acid-binding protein